MTWNALPSPDGLRIDNPSHETLEIYDLDAQLVTTIDATGCIELPSGVYIVTSDKRSRKVVVR